LRAHWWEEAGESPGFGAERLWTCRACGAEVSSIDEPLTHDQVDRVYVSAVECGGGPANISVLADCDLESVRQLMTS